MVVAQLFKKATMIDTSPPHPRSIDHPAHDATNYRDACNASRGRLAARSPCMDC